MTRKQIELKYDEFFGKGYWEEQYKKHIVEFAFQCSNVGKPIVSGSLPSDMLKLCELIINSKTDDGISGRIRDMSLSIRNELKYVQKVGGNDR